MKRLRFGVVLLCLVVAPAPSVLAQSKSPSSGSDNTIVTIDGAKNPELVPRWVAWLEAFRFMAQPAAPVEPIPSNVYAVTSAEQRALIRKEALWVVTQEHDLGARAVKLHEGLTAENMPERNEKADSFEMQRRQAALDAGDRLLSALPVEAQNALREFLEHTRKGYKVTILKSKLAQFRLPE